MLTVIARKAVLLGPMTDIERNALTTVFSGSRGVNPGQDLSLEGDVSRTLVFLLLSGIACSYKSVEEGARQITAFHVPGDLFGFNSLIFRRLSHSTAAITECKVALGTHDSLNAAMERVPRLARVLWRESVAQASIGREWMTGMGRRSAHERIAHLLCEVAFRLHSVGAIESYSSELPFTQLVIGDATGLSVVHVNRVVQRFRTQELLRVSTRKIWILDWQRFSDVAKFRSEYLHL
ncbi:MAG TPA: Crp/Fnr family transcriptional regulator [Steroidobacteraceae bacterium]|nr:Crp/Fnr family transcriptional regulator [Steroidobacteraceae bacterium]